MSKHNFSLNEVTDYGQNVQLPIATSSPVRENKTVKEDENSVNEDDDDGMILQPSRENLRIEASSIQIFSQSQQKIEIDQSDSLVEIGAQSSSRISLEGNTEVRVVEQSYNFERSQDFVQAQIAKSKRRRAKGTHMFSHRLTKKGVKLARKMRILKYSSELTKTKGSKKAVQHANSLGQENHPNCSNCLQMA